MSTAKPPSHTTHTRPVVLVLTKHFLPGYKSGGPIRTLANLVDRLGNEFDFHIVCSDHDADDLEPYPGVHVDTWQTLGKANVFYASEHTRSLRGICGLLRDTPHDLVYVNSFFSPAFTVFPMVLRVLGLVPRTPLIVAPRGEFAASALALKAVKKRLFVACARLTRLYRGATWQASATHEVEQIQHTLGINRSSIHVARNLAAADATAQIAEPQPTASNPAGTKAPLQICFLGRLVPMKNLDFALGVLARVQVPVQFTIFGPTESPDYWQQCQALIETLPGHVQARYAGALKHDDVCQSLTSHDLFFVPSRGENFGHVFVEAWSAGLPVLVSDRTPWRDLECKGVGWDLSLDQPDAFVRVIEQMAVSTAVKRQQQRSRCSEFGRAQIDDPQVVDANRRLFLDALAGQVAK